jgi:hypothetical protein
MRTRTKIAFASLALLTAVAATTPAEARVSIGIGLGYPGDYYGPPYYYGPGRAVCDPYSRWYDPYRCDGYYADYYEGPVFIDGVWVDEPLRWRVYNGRREFFWHGGWRAGTGWHQGGFRRTGRAHRH